jgi:glycosyltransferase involved in cell wall biosynthesis
MIAALGVSVRVLFETYPWAFVTAGGGERQLLKYAECLPGHGVEVVLFDQWRPDLSVDCVHFFSCMGGSVHFCNYVAQRGLPLVISSSLWIDAASAHLYPVDEIRAQLSLADVIVPNSATEADTLAGTLGLPHGQFIPVMNGVDRRFTTPGDGARFRQAFGIDGPFVLNVGNIETRKNQLALVQAARAAGLPLVLIGHVREQDYGARVFADGGASLRYLGPLEHDDPLLAEAYAACSVFALPSTLETPGLAALEAAAAGAPLVVTRVGSARDYFGDACVYVDPADPHDIARGLSDALAKPRNADLSRRVVDAFSWPAVTAALPAVYREAIARRGRRAARPA